MSSHLTCPRCGGSGKIPKPRPECGAKITVGKGKIWEARDTCHLPADEPHVQHIGGLLGWTDEERDIKVTPL